MIIKQDFNRNKGEDKTRAILSENFWIYVRSVDVDGAGLLISLKYESYPELKESYERIQVTGRVQAKYFENNNEVKIARDYVEDEEGVRTGFFALLHTDNQTNYFFKASDIKNELKLRQNKKTGTEYFIFRLTKNNQYTSFKNISNHNINSEIEYELRRTEEYRNHKYINEILSKGNKRVKSLLRDFKIEFSKKYHNKHIVDKLDLALNSFKDFRRVTAWRLVELINFDENQNRTTYYNHFAIKTNNEELEMLFKCIVIKDKVTIKNKSFFKQINNYQRKVNNIIDTLNNNGIFYFNSLSNRKSFSIRKNIDKEEVSPDMHSFMLDFNSANQYLNYERTESSNNWSNMQMGFTLFKLGKYERAKEIFLHVKNDTYRNKDFVLYFFSNYNLRLTAFQNWESEYPDLDRILSDIPISPNKKEILNTLTSDTLLADYSKTIDELYLEIKDYSQRKVVNDTRDLINKLNAKLFEYQNFIVGNWLLTNHKKEFELLVEKVIEAQIISYSLRTDHSLHVDYLDDFLVAHIIHFCEPNKLLGYFQRNGVAEIGYKTSNDFFYSCIKNFFTKSNVDFLYNEINYLDGKTKNPDLRRKIERIFGNVCILLAYLEDNDQTKRLVNQVTYFIQKIDFSIRDLSSLAHPLLRKSHLIKEEDLILLLKVLIKKEPSGESYLITNCLYSLLQKKYVFEKKYSELEDELIDFAFNNLEYDSIRVIPKIICSSSRAKLKKRTIELLKANFNTSLFYYSIVSNVLSNPQEYFPHYLKKISEFLEKEFKPHILGFKSPYTGVDQRLDYHLKRLIEIIYITGDKKLLNQEIVEKVIACHPYYSFLLNIDSFKKGHIFDLNWLLECQSDIILSKIGKNQELKREVKKLIRVSNDRELLKIFIKYFS